VGYLCSLHGHLAETEESGDAFFDAWVDGGIIGIGGCGLGWWCRRREAILVVMEQERIPEEGEAISVLDGYFANEYFRHGFGGGAEHFDIVWLGMNHVNEGSQ